MPTRIFGALGTAAVAFLLALPFLTLSGPVDAQDTSCVQRCITIHQYFADEIAATIAVSCNKASACTGEGTLRINGEQVPTVVSAEFIGLSLKLRVVTAQGALTTGTNPNDSFDVMFPTAKSDQSKNFALRWHIPSQKEQPVLRVGQNIGGHFKLIVEGFIPRPMPAPQRINKI